MRQGPSPRRVRELSERFGADRRTIARWQVIWREQVPQTPFWKIARAHLLTKTKTGLLILPRSLLEAFLGGGDSCAEWGRLLNFLSPISTSSGLASEFF